MTEKDYGAPIRVGIVGLGFAGEMALKGFWRLPQVHVLALAGLTVWPAWERRMRFLICIIHTRSFWPVMVWMP